MKHIVRILAGIAVTTAVWLVAAGPAAAHDGEGILAVETTAPSEGGLTYVVRLTWANDGHPAIDSTVTATAINPDGVTQTPVPLTPIDEDGRYQVTLPYAAPEGTWTVRLTSIQPTATLELVDQTAPAVPSTTTPTTAATTTDVAPSTDSDSPGRSEQAAGESEVGDPGAGGSVVFAVVMIVVVLCAAAVALRARQARRTTESS